MTLNQPNIATQGLLITYCHHYHALNLLKIKHQDKLVDRISKFEDMMSIIEANMQTLVQGNDTQIKLL